MGRSDPEPEYQTGAERGSPASGLCSAVLALLDGLKLSLALAGLKEKETLGGAGAVSAAVAAFEENMCAMAGRVSEKANGNFKLAVCVGPDTPQAMIRRFGELTTASWRRAGGLSGFNS